jgi:hypothetical protein
MWKYIVSISLLLFCAPVFSKAQAVNTLLITMLDYTFNCSTGMATVKYHITNTDEQGHVGGYGTSYTINLGVYSTSGFLPFGDDDVEFTGGYIIGDMISCRAWGAGNNFTYPLEFDYVGYRPKPVAPQIWTLSPIQLCNGETTTLTADGSNGNYIWSNGQTGATITVSALGTYSVQAIGSCGNSDPSNEIVVMVNGSPAPPLISNNGAASLCNAETTTLSASSSGGTITWSNGATGKTITISTAGNYTATETNGCGASGASNTITITSGNVPTVPDITPGGFPFLCDGIAVTLNVIGGGNTNWYKDGVFLANNAGALSVSTSGSYTATRSNSCGVSGLSAPVVISTGVSPAAPSISSSNGTVICNGVELTLSSTPPSSGTIRWNTSEWGNSISVTTPGTYYAYEVNACGTSGNSNSIVLTTGNTPAVPIISPTGPLNICNGNSVNLSIVGGASGNWYKDGGLVLSNSPTLTVNTVGTYTTTLSNACGASVPGSGVVVSGGAVPVAPSISSSGGVLVCNGNPVTLNAVSSGGTIQWSNGAVGNSISVSTAGTYYAFESNGCGNSANSNSISITTGITPPAPVLNVTGPITLCDGAGQVLSTSPSAGGNIRWSFGLTSNSITIYDPGLYYAYETNGCGNGPSSQAVGINTLAKPAAPTITPPGSLLLCNGQSASFNATGSNITWSNGATGNNMVTGIAGTYYAYDRNFCGNSIVSNSVVITNGNCPVPSPGTSFFICPGAMKTLDAGAGYDTYLWSNGATSRTISVGPGNYAVTVSKEGCFATSVMVTVSYYTVSVPVINPSGATTFCNGNSVTLSSSSGSAYLWSNGATGNSINVTSSGSFFVTVTDANGCQATSATLPVTVNPLPSASIAGGTTVCQNATSPFLTFSGSGGVAPYTFIYTINGGAAQAVTTTSGDAVSIQVPTGSAGSFVYSLVSVRESSLTACSNTVSGSATVVVNPLPTSTINGTSSICQNASYPSITFTGNGGVAPYTFTYSINGGASQSVTTVSGNAVSISIPTSIAGTYIYTLLGVQESSSTTCSNTASGTAIVVVNPLPIATIGGATTVCQNSASPSVTFSGSGGTAPYTFTYSINGGVSQTVSTTSGNSVSILVPTNSAGNFTYSLISVQESSSTACVNAATGSVIVTINPQPEAAVLAAPNNHLCNGEAGQITIFNWIEGNTYTWYKDGVLLTTSASQTLSVTQAGSYTVLVTSGLGCDAAILSNTIMITTGTISKPIITGYLKVCEGGKTNLLISPFNKHQLYEVYKWTDTPIGDSLGNDKSFSATAGQYRVSVEREGCFDSTSVVITKDDTEFPAGQLTINPSSIAYGGQVFLLADVSGAASYQWDFGNGQKTVSVSPLMKQNYYKASDSIPVSVVGVSDRNCKTTFSGFVKVGKTDSLVIADHSFTGNLKDWNLFPVPFHNELKFSAVLFKNETIKLDMFTADGSWVRTWQLPGKRGENLFRLDKITDLPAGVLYFVTGFYNNQNHYDKIYKY